MPGNTSLLCAVRDKQLITMFYFVLRTFVPVVIIIFQYFKQIDSLTNSQNGSFSQFPSVVEVVAIYSPGLSIATGCVIHPKWTITVAHVVLGANWTYIRAGGAFLALGREVHTPNYTDLNFPPLYGDVALIKLLTPILTGLPTGIVPARYCAYPTPNVGDPLQAVVVDSNGPLPVELEVEFIDVERVTNDLGAANFPDFPGLATRNDIGFCVGPGQTACQGNSGGPVYQTSTEFGQVLQYLISFGKDNCSAGYPFGCTLVNYYCPWITSLVPAT